MTPKTEIEKAPPPELDGHPFAQKVWRRSVKLYGELEATIVTGLDRDHLADYCLTSEEVMKIGKDLERARQSIEKLERRIPHVKADALEKTMEQLNAAYRLLINLNGRIDRKRKICMVMRHDLYLTPRSRAGVAPGAKPPEPEKDPMEEVLDGD